MQRIQPHVRSGLHTAKSWVRTNDTVKTVLYELSNVGEFSDIFEHEKMLADSVRVDNYAAAIRRHIDSDDVVVDLGTGSGILAMMAAQQGATVYAIDHSEFVKVAEYIALKNGVDTIEFRQVNSTEFTCSEDVDVVLHEIMGDDLLNENMIEYLLDLKRRVLDEKGTILPGRFDLFLEPVTLTDDHRVPFVEDISAQGIDFSVLRNHPDIEKFKPESHTRRWMDVAGFDQYLSTPEPILSFDVNDLPHENALPTRLTASRRVENPGTVDGLCVFFRVIFDEETQFDTAPTSTKTSWSNRLLRTPQREYDEGDELTYTVTLNDISDSETWDVTLT